MIAKLATGPNTRLELDLTPFGRAIPISLVDPNPIAAEIYGNLPDPPADLLQSIASVGILEPLVVTERAGRYLVVSGNLRLACAWILNLSEVPCRAVSVPDGPAMTRAVLDHNRQRDKTFSQRMREADAMESLELTRAQSRRLRNLRQWHDPEPPHPECRNSDDRHTGRTDARIAAAVGLGAKDQFRQARKVWRAAQDGDPRARSAVFQIDEGTKTIHAAYKDLRRRDRFSAGFKPTPYDVWAFRHDRAFGLPHPGSTPPATIAHLLHYFTTPDALVVDPMAGGGTTIDVCESMGRRVLAYDYAPVRSDVRKHDVTAGFPDECRGCALVFCDPPYHTMHARRYDETPSIAELPYSKWLAFIDKLAADAFDVLRPGGFLALLLANQTETDLPVGHDYIDHAFLGYEAMRKAGFQPVRRISCPMAGTHLPQQVRRARAEGRLLGVVRDLIVMRKQL